MKLSGGQEGVEAFPLFKDCKQENIHSFGS